jgi:hypothetical protein
MMALFTVTRTDKTSAFFLRTRRPMHLIERMVDWVTSCIRRYRERAELRQLDLRDRQELGHNRVNAELGKPFWKE